MSAIRATLSLGIWNVQTMTDEPVEALVSMIPTTGTLRSARSCPTTNAHLCTEGNGRPGILLGREDSRAYQVYLTEEMKLSPSSITIAVSALRFLYNVTLRRGWKLEEILPAPKKPQKLPIILSLEEVLEFLVCVRESNHRTILTCCYAAGLQISEAIALEVPHIDSRRMVIRVQQGKGMKDRYVMLSPKLLEILRNWWGQERPQQWLFPGRIPGQHISKDAVEHVCQQAHQRCRIAKPITPHSLRHAFAVRLLEQGTDMRVIHYRYPQQPPPKRKTATVSPTPGDGALGRRSRRARRLSGPLPGSYRCFPLRMPCLSPRAHDLIGMIDPRAPPALPETP
jgi:site-specific recombinase XerD